MKSLLPWILAILWLDTSPALPAEANGLRLEVQKTTISRDDSRGSGILDDRIDRKLGLKISAKNVSMRHMEEGEVEWILIVERWGHVPRRFDRSRGTVKLPALKPGENVALTAGESRIAGWKDLGRRYQDKIEGWKVIIRHNGKETVSAYSPASFEQLNAKASEAE